MNLAIPNYMMLIMKSQMTLNRLSIPHVMLYYSKMNNLNFITSYLVVMTVEHFFILNPKNFLLEQRIQVPCRFNFYL